MTSLDAFKIIMERIGKGESLEGTYNEFLLIKKDLEAANLIRTKAANNNFFKGCLLRMFCDEERGKPHFWSRRTIRDENYELIKTWIERSDEE